MADASKIQEASFESLPLRLAYPFLSANGLAAEADAIAASRAQLGSYTTTLKRAKVVVLLRHKGLLDQFIDEKWPFARTPDGQTKLARYDQIYTRFKSQAAISGDEAVDPAEGEQEAGSQFALEAQLRDYLADYLFKLELGLTQWPVENGDAVEYQVDERGQSRRIDILARDKNGLPVVIELKVSRGHEKTIGQALYYRAKIKQRFGVSRVRIFIVAAEISPELRAAASEVSDVFLYQYKLAVSVEAIPNGLQA